MAAVVNGGGGIVGEVKELVDNIGTGLLGAGGLELSAVLDGDEEFIPATGGGLHTRIFSVRQTELKLISESQLF